MAIFDTVLRHVLSQLIFRPRAIHRPASRGSVSESRRRLYASEANRWGLDSRGQSARSFIESPTAEGDQPSDRPEKGGRRFDLRAATAWPSPSGLLACGAVDRMDRRFSDRGR